jgi:glutathione S-transferase
MLRALPMIKVHHSRRARSVRVIWLLEELAIPYEIVEHEFSIAALEADDYRKLHPLGQVPVIEDDGLVLFESGAIVEYLLETRGEGRLAPAPKSKDRAEYLQWFDFGEATLARYMSDVVFHRFGIPETDRVPEMLPLARQRLRNVLEVVEPLFERRPFVLGDAFTAADIMMSYGITMSRIIGELPKDFPHLHAYLGRLKERTGYQRAWA